VNRLLATQEYEMEERSDDNVNQNNETGLS
jgi:hypothetical protein